MPGRSRVVESAVSDLESPPSDEESDAGRDEIPGISGYEQLVGEDDGDESDDEARTANGWHALSENPCRLPEGQQEDDFSRRYIARLAAEAAAGPSSSWPSVPPADHSHPGGRPGSREGPPTGLGSSHSTAVSREGTASQYSRVEVSAGNRGSSSTDKPTGTQDFMGHSNGGPPSGPSGNGAEGLGGGTWQNPVRGFSCEGSQDPAGEVRGGSGRGALGEPGGGPGPGVDEDAMEMSAERKTAILGAMKNFTLPYFPPWAVHVPEERWVGALRRRSSKPGDEGNT